MFISVIFKSFDFHTKSQKRIEFGAEFLIFLISYDGLPSFSVWFFSQEFHFFLKKSNKNCLGNRIDIRCLLSSIFNILWKCFQYRTGKRQAAYRTSIWIEHQKKNQYKNTIIESPEIIKTSVSFDSKIV